MTVQGAPCSIMLDTLWSQSSKRGVLKKCGRPEHTALLLMRVAHMAKVVWLSQVIYSCVYVILSSQISPRDGQRKPRETSLEILLEILH